MLSTIQDLKPHERLEAKAKVDAVVRIGKDKLGLDPESPDRNIARLGEWLKIVAERYLYERYEHKALLKMNDLKNILAAVTLNAPLIIEAIKQLPELIAYELEEIAEHETPINYFDATDENQRIIRENIRYPEDWDNALSPEEALDKMGLSPAEKAQVIKEDKYEHYDLDDTMDKLQRLKQAAEKLEKEYEQKSTKQMYWRKFIWSVLAIMKKAPEGFRNELVRHVAATRGGNFHLDEIKKIVENKIIRACLKELDPGLNKAQINNRLHEARKEMEERKALAD